MNLKLKGYSVIMLLILLSCGVSRDIQVQDYSNTEGIEECYDNSYVPGETEVESEQFAIYTGNENNENVDVQKIELEVQPADTKWIKKKADGNCLSADPNDCLVWCLVEIPARKETILVLSDTTQSSNYEMQWITTEIVSIEEASIERVQVICSDCVDKEFCRELSFILHIKGFLEEELIGETMSASIFNALRGYQRKHNLPIGSIDLETLDLLGLLRFVDC